MVRSRLNHHFKGPRQQDPWNKLSISFLRIFILRGFWSEFEFPGDKNVPLYLFLCPSTTGNFCKQKDKCSSTSTKCITTHSTRTEVQFNFSDFNPLTRSCLDLPGKDGRRKWKYWYSFSWAWSLHWNFFTDCFSATKSDLIWRDQIKSDPLQYRSTRSDPWEEFTLTGTRHSSTSFWSWQPQVRKLIRREECGFSITSSVLLCSSEKRCPHDIGFFVFEKHVNFVFE